MSFIKYYSVTDEEISKVPYSHGLNGITRLQIKLARLEQVAGVNPPRFDDFRIDAEKGTFIWRYRVERRFGSTWKEVDYAIAKAFGEFMQSCATV